MKEHDAAWRQPETGDALLAVFGALANPHRLRILAELRGGRAYVSQLARDIQMSRPLLHMHLQKLEAAGLVAGKLELGEEGKAMKFFEVTPFALTVSPELVALLAPSITVSTPEAKDN